MAWKFIKLNKSVSQKDCNELLDDENFKKLWKLLRIQKTCANGAVTLKLYPCEEAPLDDALGEAYALIGLLVVNNLQIDANDICN